MSLNKLIEKMKFNTDLDNDAIAVTVLKGDLKALCSAAEVLVNCIEAERYRCGVWREGHAALDKADQICGKELG
jgi:hypothetical protein